MKVYKTKMEAQTAITKKKDQSTGRYFIDQTNGWFTIGQRCRYCGTILIDGRCPLANLDCGR